MKVDRGNAGLPAGFLNKLNDACVVIESKELGDEMHYLMTRKELTFDQATKSIKATGCIGIGVAFKKDTPKSEVARVLTNAIAKMEPPRFEGENMFTVYTYNE